MSLRSPKVMMVLLLLLSGIWIYLETTSVPPELVTPARNAGPAIAPADADAKTELAAAAARFDYVYVKDLFPAQSWIPAQTIAEAEAESAPVAEVEIPAEPVVPRLPFTYLGRMQEGNEEAVIFVTRNDVVYSIQSGDVLDGTWKLSQVHTYALEWTYLPLNMTQIIRTPL